MPEKKKNRESGLGENVVMQLSRSLMGTNVRLYFDNFFTTPSLIFKLKQDQIYSCGIVRQNRKGMPENLKKDKEMKREELDRRQLEVIHLVSGGYWVRQMRQSPQAPLFLGAPLDFKGPLENSIHSFGFAADVCSEDGLE